MYVRCLLQIILIHFTYGGKKFFLTNIKKSQDCRNKGQSSKTTKKGLVKIPQKETFKVNLLVKGAFGTLNVSWTVSYEIILVLLSVCPSVHCPYFTKFSDIVHDDSWSWYLVTDEARIFKKAFGEVNLGPASLNQVQNEVFCHFIEFGSYMFSLKLHTVIAWSNL